MEEKNENPEQEYQLPNNEQETNVSNSDYAINAADPDKINRYIESLKSEQNIIGAILGGTAASLVGAILWAVITVITNYQIGYMAIGVGFIVGIAVRFFGKGIDPIYGYIGAVLSLIGCLLGNILTIYGIGSKEMGISITTMLEIMPLSLIIPMMKEGFIPIDVLFYGIALYMGYKYSFRVITEEELQQATV